VSLAALLLGLSVSSVFAQVVSRAPIPVVTSALPIVAQAGSVAAAASLAPAAATLASTLPAAFQRPVVAAPPLIASNHALSARVVPLAAVPALQAISAAGAKASALWDGLAPRPAAALGEGAVPVAPEAPHPPRRGLLRAAKAMVPLVGATAALSVLDIGVLEGYLHPLHAAGVDWSSFMTEFMGLTVLKWWLCFIPASLALLGVSGWRLARSRGMLSGMLLFLTGWEDLLYYWLQGRSLPPVLGWLDANPFIAWSRWVTGSGSVTHEGLLLAAALGMAAALALLARSRRRA